ncbi:MAG: GIY-YIG nuclease family protein [Bacillota bacterium]|nr:GIY-YIG nuclease family protein [Bacillota bacterium]
MINNNFGSKVPKNVIYCIERISDNKKYIGKTSAEVSRRWTDHIKNSLSIGTIKRQPVHDALYNDWDNFTFSIIEEVKDDKLNEREKFYINFFETDKYGFNIKSGG